MYSATWETYSTIPVNGATYNWTVPEGWHIFSGQGTPNIMVYVGNYAGIVSVNSSLCDFQKQAGLHTYIPDPGYNFWSIYPNTNGGEFEIELADTPKSRKLDIQEYDFTLYNSHGNQVYQGKGNKSKMQINVQHLKNGVYTLRLSYKHIVEHTKIVIQR